MVLKFLGFIKKSWFFGFIVVSLCLAGAFKIFTFSTSNSNRIQDESHKIAIQTVSSIPIPDSLDFAGERVPLEDFDVREALERELLINTYWQSQTLLIIKRSTRFSGEIDSIIKKQNVPYDIKYLAIAESGFLNVTSPAGAVGFWQFVPLTAREYGLEVNNEIDERYHVGKSTEAACVFLQKLHDIYKTWTMPAASYNMGGKALSKQIGRQYTDNYYDILLNDETSRYIFRILALKLILNDPLKYGFKISKEDYYQPIPFTEIVVTKPVKDWAQFAFDKGTNYKMLKSLNPWIRDNELTNKGGKMYTIRIPKPGVRTNTPRLKESIINNILQQSDQMVQ
jgi:membrane-bound lytic murein transglycosylase D